MEKAEKFALSIPEAAKLIGSNPRHVREAIENNTFPHGYRIYSRQKAPIYKIAKKPFLRLLGLPDNYAGEICNQTIKVSELSKLLGSSLHTVKEAIRNGTLPHSFCYVTAAGTTVYKIAKFPYIKIFETGQWRLTNENENQNATTMSIIHHSDYPSNPCNAFLNGG